MGVRRHEGGEDRLVRRRGVRGGGLASSEHRVSTAATRIVSLKTVGCASSRALAGVRDDASSRF